MFLGRAPSIRNWRSTLVLWLSTTLSFVYQTDFSAVLSVRSVLVFNLHCGLNAKNLQCQYNHWMRVIDKVTKSIWKLNDLQDSTWTGDTFNRSSSWKAALSRSEKKLGSPETQIFLLYEGRTLQIITKLFQIVSTAAWKYAHFCFMC